MSELTDVRKRVIASARNVTVKHLNARVSEKGKDVTSGAAPSMHDDGVSHRQGFAKLGDPGNSPRAKPLNTGKS